MLIRNHDPDQPSSLSHFSYADRFAIQWQNSLILIARLMIGAIYLQSGWRKMFDLAGTAASFPRRPLPEFLGYIAPFVEFFGGLFIMIGFATRYSALVMLFFTIVATLSSHRYWEFADAARRAQQYTQFWKNTTMKGGILLLFLTAGGKYSVDWYLRGKLSRVEQVAVPPEPK